MDTHTFHQAEEWESVLLEESLGGSLVAFHFQLGASTDSESPSALRLLLPSAPFRPEMGQFFEFLAAPSLRG
jgi:hypothetical protein